MIRRPHAFVIRCSQPDYNIRIIQIAAIGNPRRVNCQQRTVTRIEHVIDSSTSRSRLHADRVIRVCGSCTAVHRFVPGVEITIGHRERLGSIRTAVEIAGYDARPGKVCGKAFQLSCFHYAIR